MKSRPALATVAVKPTRRTVAEPAAPPASSARRLPQLAWYGWLTAALLITAAVYWPALHNGLTNWDDPDYLTNNPLLDFRKTPFPAYWKTVVSGNWHPLTMLSLSLDYALGGTDPYQFHRTSLLLHLVNVALTFGLSWQLSGGRRVAFAVALWFGIHPMHVESVAWIAERKDVLYGCFFLLSLSAYWLFLDQKKAGWFVLSLLAGLLANGAKPAAVILPALLVLLTWWHNRPTSLATLARQSRPLLPFFLLAAGFAYLTLWSQRSATAINDEFSLWQRTQLAGYGLINYLLKAVWPVGLSALYGRPGAGTAFPTLFLVYTLLSGGALASLAWLYRRSALWFFGLMFFGLNLLLTLQLIKAVGSAAYADRYTYLAYTGLFFALAMTLDQLRPNALRGALLVVAGLFSIACAWLTMQRISVWKNSETLWTNVLKTQPFSATAFSNRALYYEQHNRLEEALDDYTQAVAADPRPIFRANRAYLLSKLKRPVEAEQDADFLLTRNPNDVVALTIKGTALVGKEQLPEAIALLQKSYRLDSTYLNTLVNLGSAYFMSGQYAQAVPFYQRAIHRDPASTDHWTNLGAAYLQSHQYDESINACRRAIALKPDNGPAHLYACYALQKAGRTPEASAEAAQAQRLGQTIDARIWR